ncbi:histidine kinase N-terminal 7TM domain-containing protein [Haloarcula sp. Atlit-120R]|uniref:histidine kinase N-terminal 7TM domain-containing protein n=1 Tax=Haloarcula sp. Atlit-120R TaxID=2282135 RepID=UPI000EF239EE|nr:histidine kinase N-terminal 7TM domain-containing protein [Haloarcula sp. Atlit-120R]RLM36789.1 histidine kinase [Haloarcula sp. Atlit-120R]
MNLIGSSPAFLAYVAAYALAAAGCGVGLYRAARMEDPDTRRGMVGLLLCSGGWAALQLGFLITPGTLGYAFYLGSLVVGLATVGAWLYFCSAYTGRAFHRNRLYRAVAVSVYLAVVAVKLTNPFHGLYFATQFASDPFPHLAITHGVFHWVVTGLSYALVTVGFFMLFELFLEADYDTRPLGVLVGITALPVILDIVGYVSDLLLDINHEPLGVALFALGVLYVYDEAFLAVQLTDGVDEAVVYLDDDGYIKEANGKAQRLFPALSGSRGQNLETVLPAVTEILQTDEQILERNRGGGAEYYLVSDTSFSLGQVNIGRMLVFTDVTESERRRRELDRQNEQLEGFATAIRHELLNTLQIITGRVSVAGNALDRGEVDLARDSLRSTSETAERMSEIVNGLATLARHGQTIDETTAVDLRPIVDGAWERADTNGLTMAADVEGQVIADPTRLRDLFESGFTFAAHNDASTVTVKREADEIVITDDGTPAGETASDAFFEYGGAIPDAAAGMTLPNLRMLARTHGWDVTLDTEYQDGVRIVISNVTAPGPLEN